jgi:hypothetical protein
MITRALFIGLLSISVCAILGFTREAAVFPVVLSMVFSVVLR